MSKEIEPHFDQHDFSADATAQTYSNLYADAYTGQGQKTPTEVRELEDKLSDPKDVPGDSEKGKQAWSDKKVVVPKESADAIAGLADKVLSDAGKNAGFTDKSSMKNADEFWKIENFEEKVALAKDMIKNGKIPDAVKQLFKEIVAKNPAALQKDININDMNKVFDKLGSNLKLSLEPSKDGLTLNLSNKKVVVDSCTSTEPAARAFAAGMSHERGDGVIRQLKPVRPLNPEKPLKPEDSEKQIKPEDPNNPLAPEKPLKPVKPEDAQKPRLEKPENGEKPEREMKPDELERTLNRLEERIRKLEKLLLNLQLPRLQPNLDNPYKDK